tara:strand:- start:29 stop:784 length:756 start_codon:yes stop_codon:yes gene_type:complete
MIQILETFLLVFVGLAAGIINTLAGGGSAFTLPVLIFLGLPPSVANGTNRIVIVVQSLIGALGYKSKGISTFPFNVYLGISASFGAVIGALIAIEIDEKIFNRILAIVIITIGVLIIANTKKIDSKLIEKINGKYLFFSLIIFFFLGIYGGFLNAGIGIVIMFILNRYNGLDLVKTNATKVVLITIYSSIALIVFAYNNSINWEKGLWMALGTIYGAWWSSRWSVKKGDKVIKIVILIMITIIAIKLWFFN